MDDIIMNKVKDELINHSFSDNGDAIISDSEYLLRNGLNLQREWRPGMII